MAGPWSCAGLVPFSPLWSAQRPIRQEFGLPCCVEPGTPSCRVIGPRTGWQLVKPELGSAHQRSVVFAFTPDIWYIPQPPRGVGYLHGFPVSTLPSNLCQAQEVTGEGRRDSQEPRRQPTLPAQGQVGARPCKDAQAPWGRGSPGPDPLPSGPCDAGCLQAPGDPASAPCCLK